MPSTEQLETRCGTTVGGDWRLDALIGIGGMAGVYAASHRSGRRAAFKILHQEHLHDAEIIARFNEEKELATLIKHPARVEVLGLTRTDDGAPLLVMELLEGETLQRRANRLRVVSAHHALDIASRILDLLAACHAHGVVHRDLKPSNIFLTMDGRVKLLDFGVARGRRSITVRRRAMGTPEFMPPEQAQGRVDARSDLYALGAILWTVISGCPFRTGRTDDATLRAAVDEPIRSLALVAPEVPPIVVAIVDRALAYDPDRRFATAAAMQDAVLAALAAIPAEEPPEPPEPSYDRPTLPSTPSSIRGDAV
jgi:eukaryotic-like serine/threonine-protein kinase